MPRGTPTPAPMTAGDGPELSAAVALARLPPRVPVLLLFEPAPEPDVGTLPAVVCVVLARKARPKMTLASSMVKGWPPLGQAILPPLATGMPQQ